LRSYQRFQKALTNAFPWPEAEIRKLPDDVIVCRCEAITAGELRKAAVEMGAAELNRAKAFSRVGMGRCQGRYCASAAAQILSDARNLPLEAVGRIRTQAPVKPLTIALERVES